jgi:hypothetical protein
MEALDRPAWNPARQCTGTNRAGARCQRQPIPGGAVCVLHGGSIPAVQSAAKLRLIAMVEPILTTFEEILAAWHRVTCTGCGHVDENGVKCVGCGKPTGDPAPVIRIGQLVLDRSGFHPTLTVEQAAPPHNEYTDATEDELIERLETMLESVRASRDLKNQQPRLGAGVIDAVIDEGFEVPEDGAEPAASGTPPPIQEPGVPFPTGNDTPDAGKDDK